MDRASAYGGRPRHVEHRYSVDGSSSAPDSVQALNTPGWSIRLATVEDTLTLADIVIEAIKGQGRWTPISSTEEDDWRKEYAEWGRRAG